MQLNDLFPVVGSSCCCRYLLVVTVTMTVSWTAVTSTDNAGRQMKHRLAVQAAHEGLDVDRPAVDDPSSAVVIASPPPPSDDYLLAKPTSSLHPHQRHRSTSASRSPARRRPLSTSSSTDLTGHRQATAKSRAVAASTDEDSSSMSSRQSATNESDVNQRSTDNEGRRDGDVDNLNPADAVAPTVDGEEVLPVAEIEHLVIGLRAQLKESQATHMHTRSVINVLQEKQEAQERDLAIMKDDLARLKRDLVAERELVRTLKTQTADSTWAIADVKRGQDQVAGDLAVLKRLQEQQNETLYLVEELMMSNAVELISHNKHAVAVRHEIAQLQQEAAIDRGHIRTLNDLVQRHLTEDIQSGTGSRNHQWGEEGNSIDEYDDQRYANRLHQRPDSGATGELRAGHDSSESAIPGPLVESQQHSTLELSSSINARLDQQEVDLARLSARVAEVATLLSSKHHSPDGDTVTVGAELLQQAFVNFTRHIYGLEETWRQQTLAHNGVELDSALFHDERPTSTSVDRRLSALNTTVSETRSAVDADRSRTETALAGLERRLAELAASLADRDGRQRHLELVVVNRSLEQCRRTNAEMTVELRAAELIEKVASIERRVGEQSTAADRTETALSAVNQELRRHSDSISSLSKQTKLLRHLPPDVTTLQSDLGNFIAQLPVDCTTAIGQSGQRRPDGVYLIRPPSTRGSRTVRVYCQRDALDPATVWTVIQRRSDGRESFARGWDDYRAGFGDPAGEHWLGNDHIARLTAAASDDQTDDTQRDDASTTAARRYRLHIDMWDVRGRYWTAEYSSFKIGGPDDLFRLELDSGAVDGDAASTRENSVVDGGSGVGSDGPEVTGVESGAVVTARTGRFTGNATDALRYSDRQPFSALDRDNDVSTTDCAKFYASGWWYKHCHYANLNGRYTSGIVWFNDDIDEWLQMRQTVIKFAPLTTKMTSPDVGSHSSGSSAVLEGHEVNSPAGGSSHHRNKSKTHRIKDSPSTAGSERSG